jgi:hypothetical protein
MLFSIESRWNRPRQWPQRISSTTMCSDPSVRGSCHRKRGGLRKILRMATTVSKRRSINGLPHRNIEKISCSPRPRVSASPAQQALLLIAPIGPWRSRATTNPHRGWWPPAGRCRRQPNRKRLFNPAGSDSSASVFDRDENECASSHARMSGMWHTKCVAASSSCLLAFPCFSAFLRRCCSTVHDIADLAIVKKWTQQGRLNHGSHCERAILARG